MHKNHFSKKRKMQKKAVFFPSFFNYNTFLNENQAFFLSLPSVESVESRENPR